MNIIKLIKTFLESGIKSCEENIEYCKNAEVIHKASAMHLHKSAIYLDKQIRWHNFNVDQERIKIEENISFYENKSSLSKEDYLALNICRRKLDAINKLG